MRPNALRQSIQSARPILAAAMLVAITALVWLAVGPVARAADDSDEFAKDPTWSLASAKTVRAELLKWLDSQTESATTESAKADSPKADSAKTESAKTEAAKTDSAKTLSKPGDAKVDSAKANNADSATANARTNTAKIDRAKRDAIVKSVWPDESANISADEMLDRVVKVIAQVEPGANALVQLCSKPHEIKTLPAFPILTDEKTAPLVRNNLRLWYGRWLAQEKLYDEALEQLSNLKTTDVVDPASLLFYQSVSYHWLLQKQPGLESIGKLLERKQEIPRRYAQMAVLMQADLSALKPDTLNHIDKRMHDVENRLDLARAGRKVRTEEDGIIASLDKLIEEKEKEEQEKEGGGSSQAQGTQSKSPAADSTAARAKAKGDVGKKDIGHKSGWGDLKPKERAEALQDIGEEFPSHYRAVIEQYFRRSAGDSSDDGDAAAPSNDAK